jgi:hypothetical protein
MDEPLPLQKVEKADGQTVALLTFRQFGVGNGPSPSPDRVGGKTVCRGEKTAESVAPTTLTSPKTETFSVTGRSFAFSIAGRQGIEVPPQQTEDSTVPLQTDETHQTEETALQETREKEEDRIRELIAQERRRKEKERQDKEEARRKRAQEDDDVFFIIPGEDDETNEDTSGRRFSRSGFGFAFGFIERTMTDSDKEGRLRQWDWNSNWKERSWTPKQLDDCKNTGGESYEGRTRNNTWCAGEDMQTVHTSTKKKR